MRILNRDVFQAIADPTRREILGMIVSNPMTPNALAENFDFSRQAISKHIKILVECDLLKKEKQGREILYTLEVGKMKEIDQWLEQFRQHWENRFDQLDDVFIKTKKSIKMKKDLKMNFTVNKETKSVDVEREFAAPKELVWKAWTTPEILDQWWAPKPWKAETKSMDFRTGGKWVYAMVGPEGEKHWAVAEYLSIDPESNFKGLDSFCDEDEVINPEMPQAKWDVSFTEEGGHTLVHIISTYEQLSDLEAIIQMGFKEGFTSALENLDQLIENHEIA